MTWFSCAPSLRGNLEMMETERLQYSYSGATTAAGYQTDIAACSGAGSSYRKTLTDSMLSEAKYFKENNLLLAHNGQPDLQHENLEVARHRSGNKLSNNRSFVCSDSSSASSRDWMTTADDHRNGIDTVRIAGVEAGFSYGDVQKSRRSVKRCSDWSMMSVDCSIATVEQQRPPGDDTDYINENIDGGLQVNAPVPRKAANARERDRTHSVNSAFTTLRTLIPTEPADRKLSKIETIRLATSYIAHLQTILVVGLDSGEQPCMTLHKSKRMLHSGAAEARDEGSGAAVYPKPICTFCLSASKIKTQSTKSMQATTNCMYNFVRSGSSFM